MNIPFHWINRLGRTNVEIWALAINCHVRYGHYRIDTNYIITFQVRILKLWQLRTKVLWKNEHFCLKLLQKPRKIHDFSKLHPELFFELFHEPSSSKVLKWTFEVLVRTSNMNPRFTKEFPLKPSITANSLSSFDDFEQQQKSSKYLNFYLLPVFPLVFHSVQYHYYLVLNWSFCYLFYLFKCLAKIWFFFF